MTDIFDRRTTPAREDLAAEQLRGQIKADAYVTGKRAEIIAAIAPVHKAPTPDAPRETELLFGESVTVYEDAGGWSWVQNHTDDYVGYILSNTLRPEGDQKTNIVRALRTYIFSEPDIKSRPVHLISMNAQIQATENQGRFIKAGNTGYIIADHLCAPDYTIDDFVRVAEMFYATPYLWGGRTSLGLDCSALLQLSLARTGYIAPRDTDMQENNIGRKIADTLTQTPLQRGDLIFWKGHVGIMQDEQHMIHANGTWMCVSIDDVNDFAARVLDETGPVTSVVRMSLA